MSETNSAGQEARIDGDELTNQKTSGPVLGHGETHIPADDAVILTDGGTDTDLSPSFRKALEESECHADLVRYAELAAERGGTPILNSLYHFHEASDVSTITKIGTAIEKSLWMHGAQPTLDRFGHIDETNTEILREVADQRIRTDGGTVAARMPELPDFQRDILLTLARSEPTHGQGLIDDLGALRDESINNGRLYPNLDRLVGKGLIEKQIRVTDGRTNEYRLTPSGRAAIRAHARRVGEAVESLDFDSESEDDQ